MLNLSNIGNLSQLGGRMPGSPRIDDDMAPGGAMGPPGLPRSILGDDLGGGLGNIGNMGGIGGMYGGMGDVGGGGMGGGIGSMMTNMAQRPLRQGSLPPQATATPPHVQMGGAHGHAPSTPLRQGSLPLGGGMGMGMGAGIQPAHRLCRSMCRRCRYACAWAPWAAGQEAR